MKSIYKYEETKNIEEEKELKKLDLKRLFNLQKVQLDTINYYLLNDCMYDKNDVFNTLQEITVINMVITKKLSNVKK